MKDADLGALCMLIWKQMDCSGVYTLLHVKLSTCAYLLGFKIKKYIFLFLPIFQCMLKKKYGNECIDPKDHFSPSFFETLCTFAYLHSHAQRCRALHVRFEMFSMFLLCCWADKDIIPVSVNKRTFCAWGKSREIPAACFGKLSCCSSLHSFLFYSNSVCKHQNPNHIPEGV